MRYLKNDNTDPYFNMAFDEYALEQLPLDEPLFYLWQNRPAVIIGLNQDAYNEVNLEYLREHDIALVRRVTGGGAVYHDFGNLNYTIVGRSADLNRDYPEYTRHMLRALQSLGIEAALSGRNDILVSGRKVSGYAKRVYKDRLMVHGTLMYNVDLETLERVLNPPMDKLNAKGIASVRSRVTNLSEYLPSVTDIDDFRIHIERHLSNNYHDTEVTLSNEQLQVVSSMAQQKFMTEKWNFHRIAPKRDKELIKYTQRLTCGMVSMQLQVEDGLITSCLLSGDFIGNLPPQHLEHALIGLRYDRDDLYRSLSSMNIRDYFDGVTADELLHLFFNN